MWRPLFLRDLFERAPHDGGDPALTNPNSFYAQNALAGTTKPAAPPAPSPVSLPLQPTDTGNGTAPTAAAVPLVVIAPQPGQLNDPITGAEIAQQSGALPDPNAGLGDASGGPLLLLDPSSLAANAQPSSGD